MRYCATESPGGKCPQSCAAAQPQEGCPLRGRSPQTTVKKKPRRDAPARCPLQRAPGGQTTKATEKEKKSKATGHQSNRAY